MIATGSFIRRRVALAMAVYPLLFLALTGRLFHLCVARGGELTARAKKQWTSEAVIAPCRGPITDRNGQLLSASATAYTASVTPRQVADPVAFARALSPILDLDEEIISRRASDTSRGGVVLKRQLPRRIAQELRALMTTDSSVLKGLYLEQDSRRYYPMGAFATQLLGLTTVDGEGQSGLEKTMDAYLRGKSGASTSEVDGKGRGIWLTGGEYVSPVDGGRVETTIDYAIQSYCEQAAREAMAANRASGVRILVMDPRTGEILAMVNKPDFDPNDPPRNDVDTLTSLMRNRVVSDAYEPGSTFKIITTAVALDTGAASENDSFYCGGSVTVDGSRVRCWSRPHGSETLAQGLCNSCNPVFVELGLRIGVGRFYGYLRDFGFGKATGCGIPGEASGILISEDMCKRVDIVRVAFGQSIAVTPIQLLTAQCAAVNGGYLMKPYVVSRVYSAQGELLTENRPQVVSRPISNETSMRMRALLERVVEEGGGRNARVEGYRIGGKTGTAQVYKNGAIAQGVHIGSFVGFAPIDDPKVAVMVIVDEAKTQPDYGSVTAAPFARDILEKTLSYLGIAPRYEKETEMVQVPDAAGMGTDEAQRVMRSAGLSSQIGGSGDRVLSQLPAAGAVVEKGSLVMLYAQGQADEPWVRVPGVLGMTKDEAARLLASYSLKLKSAGQGAAVSQSPPENTPVYPGQEIQCVFEAPDPGG